MLERVQSIVWYAPLVDPSKKSLCVIFASSHIFNLTPCNLKCLPEYKSYWFSCKWDTKYETHCTVDCKCFPYLGTILSISTSRLKVEIGKSMLKWSRHTTWKIENMTISFHSVYVIILRIKVLTWSWLVIVMLHVHLPGQNETTEFWGSLYAFLKHQRSMSCKLSWGFL